MTSLRKTGLVLVSLFLCALALAPSPVRAERSTCDISDGARVCGPLISCSSRRDCVGRPESDDWFCQPTRATTPDARECMAACTTMFGCGAGEDCPPINGLIGTCQPMEGSAINVCTYRTSSAPNARITYCTDGGGHVTVDGMAACHTMPRDPGDLPVYTPDYYLGDCDGDGCANGADNDPCNVPATGGSCMATAPTATSPFCPAAPPPLACAATDSGLDCTDARPCAPDLADCGPGSTCEDGWSDGPRCRPSCSTLFLCSVAAAGMTAGGEVCPPYAGNPGTCVPLPDPLVTAYPRYTGICVYGSFIDGSCDATSAGIQCFEDAVTHERTTNFFLGDCDLDTIPNGCDSMICNDAASEPMCDDVVGEGCAATLPEPDAGVVDVDAGNTMEDAGVPVDQDAGSTNGDGGNAAFDAGTTGADSGSSSFSGGGGCRCSAAGGDRGGMSGLALTMLALFAWTSRRRR